ncbi:hypothetical protein KKI24_24305 [bacterium]|nr:hypothetical protein [bacterium]
MSNNTYPGINPKVTINSSFNFEEREIIDRLSKEWYFTIGGKQIQLGSSSIYRYTLIKPTEIYNNMFNLVRELVVIFSPYESFEPRTLDAFSFASNLHQDLRLERICSVLISKDNDIEIKLSNLLKEEQESQIIIPFSYDEILNTKNGPYFFRNRFKKHFYSRDLFAFEAPLKSDLYFFGRNDLIHSIVNRHRSNQVSGLFGLRKTGKTSVVFGIQRSLERIGAKSVFIDCQNPAFHRCNWNQALRYVLAETKKQHDLSIRIKPEDNFTEEKATSLFEEAITKISAEFGKKNILLIFDEIENITFGVSPTEHWEKGLDFVFFWQSLRSLFQKLPHTFSYLIVGTNPLCVEMERIIGNDNPIYGQIPLEYIPRFDVPQTREMVRRLGRMMGIQFDEILYGKLTEDFGGHPYLIRHVCSVINQICPKERPAKVDKAKYEKAKRMFMRDYSHFMDMILNVLNNHFNDEYEMLKYLARGDIETFKDLASLSPLYTNHLIGYGIIEENDNEYSFRIESIRDHIISKEKYKKINQTQDEMWAEISERRNSLEQKLRTICRMQLLSFLGAAEARGIVLNLMGEPRKSKNASLSYSDIFDGNKSGILFSDLPKVIFKNWDCFKNIFGSDQENIKLSLNNINKMRKDAHAKEVTSEEMQFFRVCINKIEEKVSSFLG